MHVKFHRVITLVEGVVKKTKSILWKCYLQKHFEALILFFSARLPRMWFHDENFHAQETLVKVCHKFFSECFKKILFFWFYCSHQEHLLLGVEWYFRITWAFSGDMPFYHREVDNWRSGAFWHDVCIGERSLKTKFWFLFVICQQQDSSIAQVWNCLFWC